MRSSDGALPAPDNLPVEIVGRRVRCPRDMFRWERSEAMAEIVAFVERMNAAARRGPAVATGGGGGNVDLAARVLRHVTTWAAEHGPDVGRDGAPATSSTAVRRRYREFHGRLRDDGRDLLTRAYAAPGDHRTVELPAYLERGFGDADAAAYGPQHELSFVMFLIALFKLRRLTLADEPYVVPVLYDRYLDIVDDLVRRYRLGPSDECGDAGLDDFRYVGFLWGSAQLAAVAGDPDLGPAAVIANRIGPGKRGGGVFAKCVAAAYGRAEASGRPRPEPVWRHSYRLWNLSACASWDRVNRCLTAAFRAQVLDRFRVARHLVFGELLRFAPDRRPPGVSFYDRVQATATSAATLAAAAAATDVTQAVEAEHCDECEEDGRRRRRDLMAAESSRAQEAEEELFE